MALLLEKLKNIIRDVIGLIKVRMMREASKVLKNGYILCNTGLVDGKEHEVRFIINKNIAYRNSSLSTKE